MKKEIFLDLETTGTDVSKHGIWQIAFIIKIDGEVKEERDFLVSPLNMDEYHPKAVEMSPYTKEELQNLEDPNSLFDYLKNILGKYVNPYDSSDKYLFYAYNASFDSEFLREWFTKLGDKYFGSWFWWPYIDIMTLSMDYLSDERHELENFKQETVAQHLGIPVDSDKLHDALYDIELSIEIYNTITSANAQ